jgi:hypothetical protein
VSTPRKQRRKSAASWPRNPTKETRPRKPGEGNPAKETIGFTPSLLQSSLDGSTTHNLLE